MGKKKGKKPINSSKKSVDKEKTKRIDTPKETKNTKNKKTKKHPKLMLFLKILYIPYYYKYLI